MKYLTIVLAIVLSACSAPTSEPIDNEPPVKQFEPYQVGSWMVTSPISAKWVGFRAKGDTTYFTEPDGNALTLSRDTTFPDRNMFDITYVDSTVTDENPVDADLTKDESTYWKERAFTMAGLGYSCCKSYMKNTKIEYQCGSNPDPNTEFGFTLFKPDSTHFKTIRIKADGFIAVVDSMFCAD